MESGDRNGEATGTCKTQGQAEIADEKQGGVSAKGEVTPAGSAGVGSFSAAMPGRPAGTLPCGNRDQAQGIHNVR